MFIDIIAGARPNFVKIAPIIRELKKTNGLISFRLIHTGQHYDKKMSEDFFVQLDIPEPDVNFEVGSGSQAEQTSKIMLAYENLLKVNPPEICLVVGDVNSTMACSIVAKKNNIKVAHVEAGIRSNDITMPEEVNRLITDSISDYFFTTTTSAVENLINEGKSSESIFFVGNTMIDSLLYNKDKFIKPGFWDSHCMDNSKYVVLTLHRPSNVDSLHRLAEILTEINKFSVDFKIVFPVHPRTRKKLEELNFDLSKFIILDPLSYLEFNYLVSKSIGVVTDSGGITEETTVLGIPCITLRNTTERPETCDVGTNELIGESAEMLNKYLRKLVNNEWKKGAIPELWDGNTSARIVEILKKL